MNPTGRNIASLKDWKGLKSPWIGTKNIWDLCYELKMLDPDIYNKIKSIKGSDWTERFAKEVYDNVKKYKCYSVFYSVGNRRFYINKSIEDN